MIISYPLHACMRLPFWAGSNNLSPKVAKITVAPASNQCPDQQSRPNQPKQDQGEGTKNRCRANEQQQGGNFYSVLWAARSFSFGTCLCICTHQSTGACCYLMHGPWPAAEANGGMDALDRHGADRHGSGSESQRASMGRCYTTTGTHLRPLVNLFLSYASLASRASFLLEMLLVFFFSAGGIQCSSCALDY